MLIIVQFSLTDSVCFFHDRQCVCVRVCVVSVIVKRPVLPLCVVDGRSRNPFIIIIITGVAYTQYDVTVLY